MRKNRLLEEFTMKFCCIGAHAYIVGIGETVLMILMDVDISSPVVETAVAFFMRATLEGGSSRQHHTALQFWSSSCNNS